MLPDDAGHRDCGAGHVPDADAAALPEAVHTDEARRIARGANTTLVGLAAGKILGLAGNLLLVRLLGASDYGLWSLSRSVATVGQTVGGLGLSEGVSRFTALAAGNQDARRLRGALTAGCSLALFASVCSALVVAATADLVAVRIFHDRALAGPIRLLAVTIVFGALMTVGQAASRGLQVMKHLVATRDLILPGGVLLVVVVCRLFRGGLTLALVGYVVVTAAGMCVALLLSSRLIRQRAGPVAPLAEPGRLLAFSVPLVAGGLGAFAANYMDRLIVGAKLGVQQAGYYTAAAQWATAVIMVLSAFSAVFGPSIARLHAAGRTADLARLLKSVTACVLILALPICLLTALLARPLMSVFGPGFETAWLALLILSAANLVNVATGPVGLVVLMSGRSSLESGNILLAAVLTTSLAWLLVPLYGITGAALASAVSIAIVNLLRLIETRMLIGIHPFAPEMLKPVVAAAPPLALCLLLFGAPGASLTVGQALLAACLFLGGYGLLLTLCGFSADQKLLFQDVRNRLRAMTPSGARDRGEV